MPLHRLDAVTHDLAAHYPALRAIRTRKRLLASDLWARLGGEITRVLGAVERGEHSEARGSQAPGRLRVAAWNIQRGTRFAELLGALRGHAELRQADVFLLVEVDQGLGRSGNRLVARQLAEALGMNFVFGVSYLTLEDDIGENPDGVPNTLSLAGCAILSRAPLGRVENVDVPELRDKFSSSEKRLGKKRALVAELLLPGGPIAIGCCHLDSNGSPAQRAQQISFLLDRLDALGLPRALVGGDWNTSTWDNSTTGALLRDLLYKLVVVGFAQSVAHYTEPDRHQERPVFAALEAHGFTTEGWNDRTRGTYVYDLNTAYAVEKVRQSLGTVLLRMLQRRLRPWGGVVPVHLDWFAGRGLTPSGAQVVKVMGSDGLPVSDHSPVVVELAIE